MVSEIITWATIHIGPDKMPRSEAGNVIFPTKGKYFKLGKAGRGPKARAMQYRSKLALEFEETCAAVMDEAEIPRDASLMNPTIRGGLWKIEVVCGTPRCVKNIRPKHAVRKLVKQGHTRKEAMAMVEPVKAPDKTPDVDSDACLAPIRDLLEYVGFIDDDSRIVESEGESIHSKEPFINITLRRIGAEGFSNDFYEGESKRGKPEWYPQTNYKLAKRGR